MWLSAPWLQPHRPGAVDQRVEHLVDRRQHPRRGLIATLEGDEIGHLLVERDTRDALALIVDRGQHGLRDLLGALDRLHVAAHRRYERGVGLIGPAPTEC